jgi:predicted Zn-dependent protease
VKSNFTERRFSFCNHIVSIRHQKVGGSQNRFCSCWLRMAIRTQTFCQRVRFHLKGSLLAAIFLVAWSCAAHPDLLEQIDQLTAQLKKSASADLHLERADLFRRHAQFDNALADIASAEKLQTNAVIVALPRAHVLVDAGRAAEAFENIQAYLKVQPGDPEALIIRARCYAQLSKAEAAVTDYNAVIAKSPAPGPDLFLERARQQAALGKFDDAVRGLDESITNSAGVSPLQLTAIEYERKRGAFDSALIRVDKIITAYPVKEPWLTLRAEILEQAGRTKEAEQTFQQVLAGIEKYPSIRRGLDLTKQLENRAHIGLARTEAKLSPTPNS